MRANERSEKRFLQQKSERAKGAFSLIELLFAMALMGIIMTWTGPAIQSLSGAGSINKAICDFSDLLALSRSYAMSHSTYVRVAIAQIDQAGNKKIVLMPLYAADGSLDSDEMENASVWCTLTKTVVLDRLQIIDTLNASAPNTINDTVLPWDSSSDIGSFSRDVPSLGMTRFPVCIQFSPSGAVSVSKRTPTRYIKIAVDKSDVQAGRNPFILRMSGASGNVNILRKGEGIL